MDERQLQPPDLVSVITTTTAVGGMMLVNILLAWESLGPATSAAGLILATSAHAPGVTVLAGASSVLVVSAASGFAASIAAVLGVGYLVQNSLNSANRRFPVTTRTPGNRMQSIWKSFIRHTMRRLGL